MFEFDEHFAEIEALQSEEIIAIPDDQNILPFWRYVGNDVWKLDTEGDVLRSSTQGLLNTAHSP